MNFILNSIRNINIFIILFFYTYVISQSENDDTLVLVHILFRHGDRTPDNPTYPNDPYKNETYMPYGIGQLTNKGKLREYNLGKTIRARYNNFLGEDYLPELIEPLSSNVNRTKMSLELFLAGLFPPSPKLTWKKDLNWQPIPYNYINFPDEIFLYFSCPNVNDYINHLKDLPQIKALSRDTKNVSNYIKLHAGLGNLNDMFLLYFTLKTQDEFGLILPEWTGKVYPEPLRKIATKIIYLENSDDYLKSFTIGRFWKKVIADTERKIYQDLDCSKKMFIYSGHDINIASALISLDNFKQHLPDYGSNILIEIHKIQDTYGVKIYYQNEEHEKHRLLHIPKCGKFCPLEQFKGFLKNVVSGSDEVCGIDKKCK